tara:strand:- start:5337 stop:6998 length:1662 start_codon:yes stop_codon:yes gene_type:complete
MTNFSYSSDAIYATPLGGQGGFGRNCMLLESNDDSILIDCGVMFPTTETPGVDLVIPDFSAAVGQGHRLKGLLLTHGHEDHIGAIPYLLREIKVPIYGSGFTLALVRKRLEEHGLDQSAELIEIFSGDGIDLGAFSIKPFRVCHSIPDAMGFIIRTSVGQLIHTGDYKFDHTPAIGDGSDFQMFSDIGDQGTLVLFGDSSYSDRPGFNASEQTLYEPFEKIFASSPGRIVFSTFASLISRIQQIIEVAADFDRKVAVLGRSMERNVPLAVELGFVHDPAGVLVDISDIQGLPVDRTVIICTGSQGENRAALARMANGDHRQIKIVDGDTVVLSSTPIPGNEDSVNRIIDKLFQLGANVIYEGVMPVHVSGHAAMEEIKLMLSMVRPKFLVPVHGEYRSLVQHAELAESVGYDSENIVIASEGDVIEITANSVKVVDHIQADAIYVEGLVVGRANNEIFRERKQLSSEGVLIAVVTIDKNAAKLACKPRLVTYGFSLDSQLKRMTQLVEDNIDLAKNSESDWTYIENEVRNTIRRHLKAETRLNPVILSVITEI